MSMGFSTPSRETQLFIHPYRFNQVFGGVLNMDALKSKRAIEEISFDFDLKATWEEGNGTLKFVGARTVIEGERLGFENEKFSIYLSKESKLNMEKRDLNGEVEFAHRSPITSPDGIKLDFENVAITFLSLIGKNGGDCKVTGLDDTWSCTGSRVSRYNEEFTWVVQKVLGSLVFEMFHANGTIATCMMDVLRVPAALKVSRQAPKKVSTPFEALPVEVVNGLYGILYGVDMSPGLSEATPALKKRPLLLEDGVAVFTTLTAMVIDVVLLGLLLAISQFPEEYTQFEALTNQLITPISPE